MNTVYFPGELVNVYSYRGQVRQEVFRVVSTEVRVNSRTHPIVHRKVYPATLIGGWLPHHQLKQVPGRGILYTMVNADGEFRRFYCNYLNARRLNFWQRLAYRLFM